MRWGLFSAPCQLLALAVGLPFGPIGVAIAYTVAMFGLFIPALVYAGAPLGIGTKEVLAATGPQAASGLIAATLGYMLQQSWLGDFSRLTRFVISMPICLTIYLAAVVGVFRVSGPLMLTFSLLRGVIANASRRGG